MEEKEKIKTLQCIGAPSLRKLLKIANETNIEKEDIVSLNKSEGEFILTYYK